ncbi:MAG TPA: CinA family protein, partial [Candidatus Limnocylindrales bacterium]|nr:CinA family protein [Candidatus Limnocylindrales bacterium]
DRLGATYGVSTTGEAGPDSASGQPVGTVFVAVAGPRGTESRQWVLVGSRTEIQQGAVTGALLMLAEARHSPGADPGVGSARAGNNGD